VPSRANEHIEVIARNLTFEVLSNQVAVELSVVNANNVPIADDGNIQDLTFVAVSRKAKAAVQIAVSTSLNWRALVQRYRTSVVFVQFTR
jgi:hypothetical protein